MVDSAPDPWQRGADGGAAESSLGDVRDLASDALGDQDAPSDSNAVDEPRACVSSVLPCGCIVPEVTTLAPAGYPASVVSDGVNVYWTNDWAGGSVQSVPRDGGMATTVAAERYGPFGIAVDANNVYWAEDNRGNGQLVKAPKSGGGAPTVIVAGQVAPRSVAFDGTFLYWTANVSADAGGAVLRAPPDQNASPTTVASLQNNPLGIAASHGSVYWQTYGDDGKHDGTVERWDPSSGQTTTLAVGQSGQYGIAVLSDGSTVYWTDYDRGTVASVPTSNPGSPTIIATDDFHPRGIAVDSPDPMNPSAPVVYWTDFTSPGTVWYSKNGLTCPLSKGEDLPQGIYVDDEYVYWTNYDGAGAVRRAAKIR